MRCLYCGKSLSLLKKLKHAEFCTPAHRQAYLDQQQQMGLQRLIERQPKKPAQTRAAPTEEAPATKKTPEMAEFLHLGPAPHLIESAQVLDAKLLDLVPHTDLPEFTARPVTIEVREYSMAGAVPMTLLASYAPWRPALEMEAGWEPLGRAWYVTAGRPARVNWRMRPAFAQPATLHWPDVPAWSRNLEFDPEVLAQRPSLVSPRSACPWSVCLHPTGMVSLRWMDPAGTSGFCLALPLLEEDMPAGFPPVFAHLTRAIRTVLLDVRAGDKDWDPDPEKICPSAALRVRDWPAFAQAGTAIAFDAAPLAALLQAVLPSLQTGRRELIPDDGDAVEQHLASTASHGCFILAPDPVLEAPPASRMFIPGAVIEAAPVCVRGCVEPVVMDKPATAGARCTPSSLESAPDLESIPAAVILDNPFDRAPRILGTACLFPPGETTVASMPRIDAPEPGDLIALSTAVMFPAYFASGGPAAVRPSQGLIREANREFVARTWSPDVADQGPLPPAPGCPVLPQPLSGIRVFRRPVSRMVTLRYLLPHPMESRSVPLAEVEPDPFGTAHLRPRLKLKPYSLSRRGAESSNEFLHFRNKLASIQHSEGWRFWRQAPADLKWIAMGLPVVLVLWLQPFAQQKSVSAGAPPQQMTFQQALNARLDGLKQNIASRAGVALAEDFRSGLGEWDGKGDWAKSWSYDSAGMVRPGQLALFQSSTGLTDYAFEFSGQIEKRGMAWVFRASDLENYYAVRLYISKPGPLPSLSLERWTMVNGRERDRRNVPLPITTRNEAIYKVRMDVRGNSFRTSLQDQVVDNWSDDTLASGGIGFLALKGDQARIHRVSVTHQNDTLGRLCAFFVPYNMQSSSGSWK
jgi:hypothetical protein